MAATEAVQTAIDELEAEYARIGEALEVLRKFAGDGVRPAHIERKATFKCGTCGGVFKTGGALGSHRARKH
jgi:hypothetical protein